MANLAINGGQPILDKPLKAFAPSKMGNEEKEAVVRVIESGVLSGFVISNTEKFLGGPEVKNFEKNFKEKFKVKHAVGFSSATTALHAAIVALKIGPGDEVIVPPYTMAASATAVLMNGAVPVFADVGDDDFCLDPESIKERITKNTKAIMVVNLFGGPAKYDEILAIAKEHDLRVIEDNAQAPAGEYKGKLLGTVGDIGVFSFNIHKAVQAGEGGVLVTNDDTYALRAQLCRNHGESISEIMPEVEDKVIMGSNYRLTELHAAVCNEQLKRLDEMNQIRINIAMHLQEKLQGIKGLILSSFDPENKHVFYLYPMRIIESEFGISRDKFVDAMEAEGFPMSKGYTKPIYLLPIFQNKKVFNETNFPFESKYYDGEVDYSKGICPTVERLYEKEFTFTSVCAYPYSIKEADLFVEAVKKVIEHKDELV